MQNLKCNHCPLSRSKVSWRQRTNPHNFFNIRSCQKIQMNFQCSFFAHPPDFYSTPQAVPLTPGIGQHSEEMEHTCATSLPTGFSLTESLWSLPILETPQDKNDLKSQQPLKTSEKMDSQSTTQQSLSSTSTMDQFPVESGV